MRMYRYELLAVVLVLLGSILFTVFESGLDAFVDLNTADVQTTAGPNTGMVSLK